MITNIPYTTEHYELKKAHPSDAAYDLHANETVTIPAGETHIIPTGIRLQLPPHHVAYVHSRSGLATKGIFVANAPGVVDSGYTGEVKVILHNSSKDDYTVANGDRCAQLIIQHLPPVNPHKVDQFTEPHHTQERGERGFGSSGI